jgi:hypothetical protein
MLQVIKKSIVFLVLPYLTLSCTTAQEGTDQKLELTDSTFYNNTVSELTPEQQSAFDALNTLQVSTDEKNRLYSTFADIVQPCYPADTSFVISQSELLIVMKQIISKNCKNLTVEKQNELAATSVLAQEEYKILHCGDNSYNQNYENGLPMTGTWVMPSVIGRRDIILVW